MIEPPMPDGLTERSLALPTGVALRAVERPGTGTPVVCLHGIWDSWRYWIPLAERDSEAFAGRPLVLLDQRGHGGSSKPEAGYALDDYARDVVALVTQQGWQRVTLAGHSLGALVTLLAAPQLGERVESLLLEDPPLPLRRGPSEVFRGVYEMRAQSYAAIVDDFMVWRPWQTREQAEASARNLLQTADGVFQAMFTGASDHVEIPVPGVTLDIPALVIRAGREDDRALADAGLASLEAALPRMTLVTIPDASHNVLRDAPAAYRAAVARVLGG